MSKSNRLSRRSALMTVGAMGGAALLGGGPGSGLSASEPPKQPTDIRQQIFAKVWSTPFVDTHEHLPDEKDRIVVKFGYPAKSSADDWSLVMSGYLDADLATAGMPEEARNRFQSMGPTPREKWELLAPYWPAVKNTGYAKGASISLRELYGVEELSADTVDKAQQGYEEVRRRGFYQHVLRDVANVESSQVNCLQRPFLESEMPTLLMADLSIVGMFSPRRMKDFRDPAGIDVKCLDDWHKVIDWWFEKYGRYAVAVKSQDAYRRNIDYTPTSAEKAEPAFKRRVEGEQLSAAEAKLVEDHLFWYAVEKATANRLPVKLHTGYYSGNNNMPLGRLMHNAAAACDLCCAAPETPFVFMHICYPYYEELLALAKQYTNAYVDMCWGWIINPVAAKDFFKKFLVTVPANKILTFGGDHWCVEQVVGHAVIARQGIALALSELVEEGLLTLSDALAVVDPVMHGNARQLFRLDEKEQVLKKAPWL